MTEPSLKDIRLLLPALVIGCSLIASAGVGGYAFYAVRSLDNTLVTTGSAKESVRADRARWRISVQRTVPETGVSAVYGRVSSDAEAVQRYLVDAGLAATDITASPIFVEEYWSGVPEPVRRVMVRQEIVAESDNVELIKKTSENTIVLAKRGIQFSPQAPEFYVSYLPELRVSLLGKAVEDARRRAESIGAATGQKVGKLKSASSGVVQVMQPNSVEVQDYGSYDTATIEKDVMVTVRSTFLVD